MRWVVASSLLPLLFGCSNILDINGVTVRDAGVDTPPPPPPNTVIGRSYTRHHTPAGMMDVPHDLTQAVVQALVVDPSLPSGYRVAPGTGKADGTFEIPDVPDGLPLLLKLDTDYFATTQHALERRIDLPIRGVPPPAMMSSPTSVSFNLQSMSPVVAGPEGTFSRIDIRSLNAGYLSALGGLVNNARALVTVHDWATGVSVTGGAATLPEAAHGDDLTVLHLRTDLVPGQQGRRQRVTRVIDTFSSTGVTIANGVTTMVGGSWQPAPMNRSMSISVTRGAFDAGYDPTTEFEAMTVELQAHPVQADRVLNALLFNAELLDWSRSGSLNEAVGFMYADPFPAAWQRVLHVDYVRQRHMRLPGTSSALGLLATNAQRAAYTGGAPSTMPVLQPPANVQVAGNDATTGGLAMFDGVAPVELTWTPVPAAEVYVVHVHRVFQNGTQTRSTLAARLTTDQAAILIPAEVFAGGEFFVFRVDAEQSQSDYGAGELIPSGLPHASADAISGMFRLSDRCGNGTTDTNELCDTSGQTATCDVDCTPVQCGDGLRNAAVEACDTVRDTSGCDADCTLPLCGDNLVNDVIEDCDDGMAGDQGNGCSAACKRNNVCGDGIVQGFVEACDPGGAGETATCDRDCTSVQCGDAHHNPLANEECDDGNSNNADGCTTACRLN